MAIFHVSKSTPTKAEVLSSWLPKQTWGPGVESPIERVGSFHFDDPEGRVGMETHLVRADGVLFQVPLTYRDAPLADAEESFVATIEHSVLGTRWIYDGLGDARYLTVLAGVALTGQGQALGLAQFEGRWYTAPSEIRIQGGGWGTEPAAVDGFEIIADDAHEVRLQNDHLEMRFFRRPATAAKPAIGLSATWLNQPDPMVLAEMQRR